MAEQTQKDAPYPKQTRTDVEGKPKPLDVETQDVKATTNMEERRDDALNQPDTIPDSDRS